MNTYKAIQNAHKMQQEIESSVEAYEGVLIQNYHKYEAKLVGFLLQEVRYLKKQIATNKMKTSQESIDALIAKKRSGLEAKRQKEEVLWRELTEKFKKLQEEEKKLANENKESEFDVSNLLSKIKQFQSQNQKIRQSISNLQNKKIGQFVTQIAQEYSSPYKLGKICLTLKEKRDMLARKHLESNEDILFSKKYRIKQPCGNSQLKQNQKTENSMSNTCNYDSFSLQKKQKSKMYLINPSKKLSISKIKSRLTLKGREQGSKQNQIQLPPSTQMSGYAQLLKYISLPLVRDRIFDLIRK